jgi:hypothetical protein
VRVGCSAQFLDQRCAFVANALDHLLVRRRKLHDRRRHRCGRMRRLMRATEERSGYRACAPRAADLQDLDHDLREVWKASEH